MTITKKFIILSAINMPILLIASFLNLGLFLFISYNIILLVLLLWDYTKSPSAVVFDMERISAEKISLSAEYSMDICIRNNSIHNIKMEIKDTLPDFHFKTVNLKNMKNEVSANSEKIFSYTLNASKRGCFKFGEIYGRYEGLLGLCKKQFKIDLTQEFKVYPKISDINKYRIATQKNIRLQSGLKPVRLMGRGLEFESLRDYVIGDDYRAINWNATSRENKIIVNNYELEKKQPVYMLLDVSRPMSYSVHGYSKLDYAINACIILSDIVNLNGDLSGLMTFDTEIRSLAPPSCGAMHRNNIMEALYHVEDSRVTADYELAFKTFVSKQKRRSLVFLFTDFTTLEEASEITKFASIITRRHILIIMLIKNESLESIATGKATFSGAIELKEIFQKGVALEFLNERKKIIKSLAKSNIMCIESPADKLTLHAFNNYISAKGF